MSPKKNKNGLQNYSVGPFRLDFEKFLLLTEKQPRVLSLATSEQKIKRTFSHSPDQGSVISFRMPPQQIYAKGQLSYNLTTFHQDIPTTTSLCHWFRFAIVVRLPYRHHLYHNGSTPDTSPKAPHKNTERKDNLPPLGSQSRMLCQQRNVQKWSQHSKEIPPLSAPSNSRRFKGRTAIEAMTPRNVSDRSLVLVKMACGVSCETGSSRDSFQK